MEEEFLTLGQVSKQLGVPTYTLRRFCNASWLPGYKHTFGARRLFSPVDIEHLRVITGLRKAGFTTKDIRKYLRRAQSKNPAARHECREMLATHKRQIWQELEKYQKTIDFLERQEDLLRLKSS